MLWVALAVLIVLADATEWRYCDGSPGNFDVESVTLTPDPPQLGADVAINVTGIVPHYNVTDDSTLTYEILYYTLPLRSKTIPLNQTATLPVMSGDPLVIANPGVWVSSSAPPGSYTIKSTVAAADVTLGCVQFSLLLSNSRSVQPKNSRSKQEI